MSVRNRAALGLLLLSVALPAVVHACRCVPRTFTARVDDARLIVLGRVAGTIGDREVIVVIEERFKGSVTPDTLTFVRTDSSCELFERSPELGTRYLLLAGPYIGSPTARKCSGSGPADERADELGWLRDRQRAGQ